MSYVNVGSFEQVFQKIADRAMFQRKTGVKFHPGLSTWDQIKAILEPQWKTTAELIELTGRKPGTVVSTLVSNKAKLRFRQRKDAIGRKREYRLR